MAQKNGQGSSAGGIVGSGKQAVKNAGQGAKDAAHSDTFRKLARVGHVANGILHIMVGVLAWQIAFGGGQESADQSGAAKMLTDNPVGLVLLWVTIVGCVMLALFHASAVVWGYPELKERVKAGAKAAVFAVIGFTFGSVALGGDSSSSESSQSLTAALMSNTAGAVLLIVIGTAVIAVGGYHVYSGVKKKFAEDLESPSRSDVSKALIWTGVVGFVAKGIVLAMMGVLFIVAVAKNDPADNTGMDGALKTLQQQPFGVYLLAAVGVGLILYGIHQFLRSRYDRMEG